MKLFNMIMVLLLSLNAVALELKAKTSEPYDFVNMGYAVTGITVTVTSGGKPVSGVNVVFVVESVKNESKAVVEEWKNRITGLSWDKPVPGNIIPPKEIQCVSDKSGKAEVALTDIIGERSIIILITADTGFGKAKARVSAEFGKGPLSLFNAPYAVQMTWPDAFNACNGTRYTKDPSDWQIRMGYEGKPEMPTVEQLQSVAMPGIKNSVKQAMGAAAAAGWRDGTYWSGRALMKNRASHVRMRDGNVHGTGGRNVYEPDNISCLH